MAFVFRFAAKHPRLRSRAIRKICDLEGGQMWSATYRDLMRQYYKVDIGKYSYGPCLMPTELPEGTRVGNYCSFARGVTVFRRNHPARRMAMHPFFYNASVGLLEKDSICADKDHPLNIGADVWIGSDAIITPRCESIGLGAIIGAGAVVTKNVPPFAIVAGNPAKQIGERFPKEIQEALSESRWWEQPIEQLMPVFGEFLDDATADTVQRLTKHLRSNSIQQ